MKNQSGEPTAMEEAANAFEAWFAKSPWTYEIEFACREAWLAALARLSLPTKRHADCVACEAGCLADYPHIDYACKGVCKHLEERGLHD